MSVAPPSMPVNVPRPMYVLPNTQHIRINQGKRGREDDDSAPVVDSAKRVKPLEPVGSPKSTPRAIKNARRSGRLRARVQPSIKDTSEYLGAMLGYDSEKHYDYGSDTDEEDPSSDPDEPMPSADEDDASTVHDDEDQAMTDISEEAFRAELDQMFVGSDELVKTFFVTDDDSDSDGELADDESEIGVNDAYEEPKPKVPSPTAVKVIEWAQPGPSPLRHETHLAPDRPKMPRSIRRSKEGWIPIVRSSRHTQGIDRENTRKGAMNKHHCRCTHLPCTDYPQYRRVSGKALGKEKALPPPPATNDGKAIESHWPDSDDAKQRGGMGQGTPPRFGRWTPLTPPPSQYSYSRSDDTIPFPQFFGQDAFHGADAWGTLFRAVSKWGQTADGKHLMLVGMGPTMRLVYVLTDKRALQHLREHGEGVWRMPSVVPREELRAVTTGMLLDHEAWIRECEAHEKQEREARTQASQSMQRARAPSPEELVNEDVPMEMVLIDEDDMEELGL